MGGFKEVKNGLLPWTTINPAPNTLHPEIHVLDRGVCVDQLSY